MTERPKKVIALLVLRAVGARAAGAGFERPAIEGYSHEQIDAAVDELRRGGYLIAADIPHPFGTAPRDQARPHWAPSELTVPGRHLLEELEKTAGKS